MTQGKKRKRRNPGGGVVYLVGAGPGDPGLITVRGRELLGIADAIVYDALANPEFLKVPRAHDANAPELHDVGKRGGDPESSARQDSINELLITLARKGKRVVRLKGGDPFVFGRGSEEAQALNDAGVMFEVVPGITAGIAAPAYAGIPVTHRGMSTSVTLVTGHEDATRSAPQVDWHALAASGGTIVLYMGVKKLPAVAAALMDGGMPPDIPAAAVQWGTLTTQRTVVATLATLVERAATAGIGAPAIMVIGWTVVLRDEISWFDRRPLFGQRILVTRAADAAGPSGLGYKLRELGAQVVETAATRIAPMSSAPLAERIANIDEYSWVVFTSVNAVDYFWRALAAAGRDTRALSGVAVAAVGPATAAALLSRGVVVDVQAKRFAAEGLLEVMAGRTDVDGSRILYPCAEGARPTLELGLQQLGAIVDREHAYRSAPDDDAAERLKNAVSSGELTLVVFTSASGARSFARAVGAENMGKVPAVSIGPVTTAALGEVGIPVVVEADDATMDGVARAILTYTGSRSE